MAACKLEVELATALVGPFAAALAFGQGKDLYILQFGAEP